MKTPDITRCYRDPSAYPESANAREYFHGPGASPETPKTETDKDRWVGETDPHEGDAPSGPDRSY